MDPWLRGLAPALAALEAGPALDVACGLGENTQWLASLRGAFTASTLGVDSSPVAVERASERARSASLPAQFEVRDLSRAALPRGPWAIVVVLHYLDRALFASLEASLAPGGLLVFKTHLDHPLRDPESRPRNPDHLLRPGELLWSFPTLIALRYEEWSHQGGAFAGLLARRPLRHSL